MEFLKYLYINNWPHPGRMSNAEEGKIDRKADAILKKG